MPLKDPQAKKVYQAQYYLDNREALALADKIRHAAKPKKVPVFKFPSVGPGLNLNPARLQAEREGRKTWDPGFPCVNGHLAHRATGGGMACIECTRLRNDANKAEHPLARVGYEDV
jgi:hypothetical protein